MDINDIKYVAIYLRKSRGDEETALEKHRLILTELCEKNNWKYVEYQEIVSGENIAMRPVFKRLLDDIKNGVYSGCCVVDIDRLGRGNQADQGEINQAFSSSDTYIITPQQIYNLNDDSDEMIVDIRGFVSRQEYKQIVKRLSQGKKVGSRLGNWTNGTPPYGYSYQRYKDKFNENGLVVNDEQYKVYRLIIDSVIKNRMTIREICIMLNNMNIPSPRNSVWQNNTIHRLLIDETYLGKIISNKTRGNGHVAKNPNDKKWEVISKEKWVVVNNCHEAIKTQEEHEQILVFLSRLTHVPHRTQNEILPLSSLIKCKKCGHTMSVYKRKTRNNEHVLKPCWHVDANGNKCGNSGINLDAIYENVKNDIERYKYVLEKQCADININENKLEIEQQINMHKNDMDIKSKSLERVMAAFEEGLYTLEQFKERKQKIENTINQTKEKIEVLEIQYNSLSEENLEDKIKKLQYVFDNINNDKISDKDKNKLYKTIIDCIIWERNGDDMSINIKYL